MDFAVYILKSERAGIYYVGFTSNLILRMMQHNHSEYDKKAFTYKYRPWIVVHVEFFETKIEASTKEKQIKKRGAERYLLALRHG